MKLCTIEQSTVCICFCVGVDFNELFTIFVLKGDFNERGSLARKKILTWKLGNKNVHNQGNTYFETYTPIDGMGYNKL